MTVIDHRDAKSRLAALLDRAARGERFLITRHGRPVARLLPLTTADVKEAIRQMQQWQEKEGPTLGRRLTIEGLRKEGRRI